MEFLIPSSITCAAACIFAAILLYYLLRISISGERKIDRNRALPEVAGAWPVIGHLHLLGGSQLPHLTLGNMADKYGPIFKIKFGVHQSLVVSSPAMAKECLNTNDKVFAGRPKSVGVELMGYNYAMFGFAQYGPYWRQLRKIATLELLSNHRLEMLKHIRESEVKASLKEIYDRWANNTSTGNSNKVSVEMKQWFGDITLNMILRMVIGEQYYAKASTSAILDRIGKDDRHRFREAVEDFQHLIGLFVVADALPFLRWLDIGGYEKEMKKTAKKLDSVLQELLEQHKQNRVLTSEMAREDKEKDFMDVMLSILNGEEVLSNYDADTVNKATCLALIIGGTDTTTVTLTWALSLLLNNPRVLKKAQDELDTEVGRERQVNESDIKNLVYLQAIIKETLRLYPAATLLPARESMEDCTVGGYHVPAGTRMVVNAWKIHRDPHVWSNPDDFWPERFLTTHKDVDVRGQHFELIPFGSGRRICPGISLALQVSHFMLASLLQGFELATPTDEPVDMSERFGLTVAKVTPLQLLLIPRLPADLYA